MLQLIRWVCAVARGVKAVTLAAVLISASAFADAPPTVAVPASANPAVVTAKITVLSVLGADDGGAANLVYTWSTVNTPPAVPTYSRNGSNAAKQTTVTFKSVGSYTFQVVISDKAGQTATSEVTVAVSATPTSIALSPTSLRMNPGTSRTLTAVVRDQFVKNLAPQPAVAFAISGGGTVGSDGVFTAAAPGGPYTLTASSCGRQATASITVNAAPALATPAGVSANPVTTTNVVATVLGADDAGEAALTYSWSATGPASVTFSPNASKLAKATQATFKKPGQYVLKAVVKDAQALTATSTVPVTVVATAARIVVTPATVALDPLSTRQFSATAYDQFNVLMASQPAFTWSAQDISINASGLATADGDAGVSYPVFAHVGSIFGSAVLQINNVPTPPKPIITPAGGSFSQPQTVSITPAVFAPLTTTPGWRTGVKYPGQGIETVEALSQDGATVAAMRGRTMAKSTFLFPGASLSPDSGVFPFYIWRLSDTQGPANPFSIYPPSLFAGVTENTSWDGNNYDFYFGETGNRVFLLLQQFYSHSFTLWSCAAGVNQGATPSQQLAEFPFTAVSSLAGQATRMEFAGNQVRLLVGATPLVSATTDANGWVTYTGTTDSGRVAAPLGETRFWLTLAGGEKPGFREFVVSDKPQTITRFTSDGSRVTEASSAVTGPLTLTHDATIRARVYSAAAYRSPETVAVFTSTIPLLPAESFVSPAYMEILHATLDGSPALASLSGPSGTTNGFAIMNHRFILRYPLQVNEPTPVTLSRTTLPDLSTNIVWREMDLAASSLPDPMTIRAGDSLLFTAGVGATGTLHIAVMDGSNQVCQTREGVTGEKLPVRFDQGGTFTVIASVDGISVGSLIVHVVYIDFDGPVACQVGYRREKGVAVYGPTDQVFFTAKDPALLEVSVKGVTSYGVRLYLKALGRGTPVVQARLGSATGPILAEQELDEFILDTSAVQHLVVNGETDTANSIVTMSPWIPNLNINFAMYAHYSTFAGGATAYTLNTSDQTAVDINGDPAIDLLVDPATGETQAVMHVDIEMPPAESSYCFSASFDQHSKYGTLVSYPVNCNGSSCRWTMTEAYWGVNEITAYPNLNLKYVIAKCTEGHNRHHGVVSAENGFDVTNTSGLDMVCVKGNHYSFLVSKSQVKPRGRYDLMMSSSNPGTPGTPFTKLIVYKVVLNQCDASWDPKGQGADEADRLTKITASTSPSAVPGRFKFTLYEVSNEPGYCMNAPAIVPSSGPDSILWKDLQCLDPQSGFNVSGSNKEEATTVLNNLLTASVIIKSYDYGAYGKIKVEFAANDGSCYTCMGEGELGNLWTPIPDDTDGNHIRDTWAHNAGSSTDDTDASLNNTGKGDGLTRYEEYRGVDINHDGKISPDERLNPDRKDLFVQGIGFGGADFPVFSYGTAFNEAAIDVHEFLGAVGTDDRNIDVLVETCLDQGGHIRRIGVQKWSWSQKGQSSGGTITAYGAPEINKKACNFYFTDKPYKDGKTWSAVGQWNAPKNGVLDPVTKVEDSNDDGELNANENDGATLTPLPPPDDGDNELDGDYVVATSGGGWDWNQDLNPCDINNNGKVELGISIAMPVNAGDEYSKEQVVRHTATHEIGHAVGIRGTIAGHCDDETCLMYLAGNNWKRDGHFCTDCRGMIKIHNN